MENNATDSGSRVTRSQRKRLESVDSDNPSRPATPISSKLTRIPDISSPSKLVRTTRRNSTSGAATPTKTPAKRSVVNSSIAENSDSATPTRTRTRRRSTSVQENEESFTRTKVQKFPTLDEEVPLITLKPTIVTRSQSKSPQQNNSLNINSTKKIASKSKEIESENIKVDNMKKRKVGPKSKTRGHEDPEDVSDGEVSVFDNETEDYESVSSAVEKFIFVTDEEESQGSFKIKEEEFEELTKKVDLDTSPHTPSFIPKEISNVKEPQTEEVNIEPEENNSSAAVDNIFEKLPKDTESSSNHLESKETTDLDDKNMDIVDHNMENKIVNAEPSNMQESEIHLTDSQESNSSNSTCTTQVTVKNLISAENFENVDGNSNTNKCETPDRKPFHSENAEILSTSTLNRSVGVLVSKKVEFISSPTNDNSIKNIYPKTPVSRKVGNSFKENRSPCEDDLYDSSENYLKNCQNHKREDSETEVGNEITESEIFDKQIAPQQSFEIGHDEKDIFPIEEVNTNKSLHELDNSTHGDIKRSEDTTISISEANDNISSIKKNFPDESEAIANGSNSNSDILQNNTSNNCCVDDNVQSPIDKDELTSNIPSPKNEELGQIDEDNSREENHHEKIIENDKHKITSENHNDDSSPNKNSENVLKWTNPSVIGTTTEGAKLDSVVSEYTNSNTINLCDENSIKKQTQEDPKECATPSSEEEQEEGEEQEQSDGGDSEKERHEFLDDEAMVVNGYESGDSLDSEERREIQENEIPVDGESIGTETTDDADDEDGAGEEEGTDEDDSFIVSDSEDVRNPECGEESDELSEEINKENRNKNKKIYKRLQHVSESSSTSDEGVERDEEFIDKYRNNDNANNCNNLTVCNKIESEDNVNEDDNLNEEKPVNECLVEQNKLLAKSRESISLNSSKQDDSTLQLHCSLKSEDGKENNEEKVDIPKQEFLQNLNQLHSFNKSILDMNQETDEPPLENIETEMKQAGNEEDEKVTTSTSPNDSADRTLNIEYSQSENDFGKESVTSESDFDKENAHKSLLSIQGQEREGELSISVHNFREKIVREGRQRSFTIDVTVKDGEIETDVKLNKSVSSSSPSTDSLGNEDENANIKHLETNRQIPFRFSNPLIRTRRQSLVLPANPDSQICADVNGTGRKVDRKSLGVLSNNDFKPSQSFIDIIELQKCEGNSLVPKRKRLSKSFCGASETLDNSVIDIDVRHLPKRSKLMGGNSTEESQESMENINSSKHFTKISSTPYEKTKKTDPVNHQRILARCDEILEAANRAKFEAKTKNRKNKTKISKRQSKKKSVFVPPVDVNVEPTLRKISKEIKRKDKTKKAVSHAIIAADAILSRKSKPCRYKGESKEPDSKQLPVEIVETIGNSVSTKKQFKKETIPKQGKIKNFPITSTAAGRVVELPKSPEKKLKNSTYIQLSTGKVSVEPITPKKRLVKAVNGAEFRESPASPCAVGFKVRKIAPSDNASPSSILKAGKRKRCDGSFKDCPTSKTKWTQSGFFKEEQISRSHGYLAENTKNRLVDNRNFKEKSLMRPDIQRGSKRDILLLKQRRQI